MINGIHFLLTYTCNAECDHCFLHCSPRASGTFTLAQVRAVLAEARAMETVEWIFFEGGEPTLYFTLLQHSLRTAAEMGFRTGVVTNAYLSTAEEDACLWLGALRDAGAERISISEDAFHFGDTRDTPAGFARRAAQRMGLDSGTICIEPPSLSAEDDREKGAPVVGGGVLLKGRAADKLVDGLPGTDWRRLDRCRHEELVDPERVHVDALGHVHICQGISMGNMWETPLSRLTAEYDASRHPITGPLLEGGPACLATTYGLDPAPTYVDDCHCCYRLRAALRSRFPRHLAPPHVYGVEAA